MRIFVMLFCLFSIVPVASETQANASLGSFKDRLAAVVEKKAVTEKELMKRFDLYSQIYPHYEGRSYAEMRDSLLEELCLERINDLLWSSLTNNRTVDISNAQLQAFRARNPGLEIDDDTLRTTYIAWIKKDNLARHLVFDKISISQQDLAAATRQPMLWQALESSWSFDLAYNDTPMTEAKAARLAKNHKNYSIARLPPDLLQSIDWSKQHAWQFFESDGEFVGVRINHIQLAGMLPYLYKIRLIPEGSDRDASTVIAQTLSTRNDAPPELWAALERLAPGEISEDTLILGQKSYYVELVSNSERPSIAMIESRLIEALRNHRAQEKMPSWYAELKSNYFIKIFPS